MKAYNKTGHKVHISRRWLPWRRKTRSDSTPDVSFYPDLGDDPLSLLIAVILLPLLIPIILFILLGIVELLLLALLLVPVLAARSLLGVAWLIEVQENSMFSEPVYTEKVKGFRASKERIDQLAEVHKQQAGHSYILPEQ